VIQAVPALVYSVVSLKLFGFRKCYERAVPVNPVKPGSPDEPQLHEAALAVKRVSNGLRIGTCLSRSLALRGLLHKHGIPTQLRIGVDKSANNELKAHAWVEFKGIPIGEKGADEYKVFANL